MSIQFQRHDTGNGAAFLIGTDSESFVSQLKQAANGTTDTPTPTDGDDDDPGGPVTRFTDAFSPIGMGVLEQVGLHGHEIANDIQTRVAELYRNEFPVLEQRFERKCGACDAEYDERVDTCPDCGGDTRGPDQAEKRRVAELVERINAEGQSLREVAKELEWDQWLRGVPVLVLRHEYELGSDGGVVRRTVDELIAGDAKRIVPVVDEHRRIGGYWWACPRCRHHDNYQPASEPGRCEHCDAIRREVYFAERGDGYDDDIAAYYFEEEILTFPWPFPRLHGLDGLSPVHHVWLKQLIIDFQDRYAGAFYDPESDRLPNQFIVLHTTNPDRWEARLTEARENAKDDQYDSPVFANEYSPQDNSTPEVQVVDAMPDELLGQNQELRETFKADIRRATNISDLHDNDLSDAGGLNNEGLQLEVTDRPTATQMHDYQAGWLDELAKRLGIADWQFGFIPATGPDAEDLRAEVEAGLQAEQGGLDARMVDGQVEIADGEFDPADPEGPAPEGAPDDAGMGGNFFSNGDASNHDFGPEVDARAGVEFRQEVPDNAIRIDSPSDAPEDAKVIEGPRGGTYYVPADDDAASEDGPGGRDLSGIANDDGTIDAAALEPGDEPLIHDEPVTIQGIEDDEHGTMIAYEGADGEDYFIYADLMEGDIEAPGGPPDDADEVAPDQPDGDGGAAGGDADAGDGTDDTLEGGDEVTSPAGNPATVVAVDHETDVVLYETGDGEERLAPKESFTEDDAGDEVSEQAQEIKDRTGIEAVNAPELDDQQAETIASAWEEYAEVGDLGELAVTQLTTTPPEDVSDLAGASYTLSSRTLYVNPDGLGPKTEDFEEGLIATESAEGTVHHELAHAEHFNEILADPDMDLGELRDQQLDEDQADLVADEVSWYASTSPTELVAEVRSGMMEGHEYSDEVMDLYEQFGGPEVVA